MLNNEKSRFYCMYCKTEMTFEMHVKGGAQISPIGSSDIGYKCKICGSWSKTLEIPYYETPEQYKKRTGKTWEGLIWFRKCQKYMDIRKHEWSFSRLSNIDIDWYIKNETIQVVCAQSCEPPLNWMETNA